MYQLRVKLMIYHQLKNNIYTYFCSFDCLLFKSSTNTYAQICTFFLFLFFLMKLKKSVYNIF
ncbi:hypothetical protein PFUGPA_05012 [Plasmodium falciparum Palo Alto/Uganda]|uniref:Uncharacterized protein n=2 Tax=Plasmodium falciparum TaxID=5833 RepID=W4IRK6_PLAFP|nr:hypothetical protein PFUGPA_05012 [Plasmodium falciparum Palo Alto/Uganda]EUR70681.1 hypothetical protein PFBG_03246 [Plasmodium falciparum 7G8]